MIVYCTGYLGERTHKGKGKVEAFRETILSLDAVVYDIRLVPWSKAPCWRKEAIAALVGQDRYLHVPSLGNRNFKRQYGEEAGVMIADLTGGRAQVLTHAQTAGKTILLLCGCEDVEECHRKPVAQAFLELPEVEKVFELRGWGPVSVPSVQQGGDA